jgi:hypothetical protein
VDERNLRSCRVNGGSMLFDIGQRFATEGSPEIPQKNEDHGSARLHVTDGRRQRAVPTLFCHPISNLIRETLDCGP